MATTPTTKSKSKKPLPVKFEDDSILGAPIQDEILKRIGEQAKDWEETPRKPRSDTAVATARTAERAAAAKAPKSTGTSMWVTATLVLIIAALGGTTFWMNTRVVALEHSLSDANTIVKAVSGQMIELQKSQDETQSRFQAMQDALAAAAAKPKASVAKPAAAAGLAAPGAQNPAVKTK